MDAPPPPPEELSPVDILAETEMQILSRGLNARETAMVAHFIDAGGNIAQAALKAGYSPETIAKQVPYWFDQFAPQYKPKLAAAIRAKQEAIAAATGLHIYDLIEEMRNIVFTDPLDLYDDAGRPRALSEIPKHARMAIEEIETFTERRGEDNEIELTRTKFKLRSKDSSVEKLMKYLGGYERDNAQRATSYVVLATPPPPQMSEAGAVIIDGTAEEIARARNRADLERSNEWVIENDLPDPIIIKGK